MSREHGTGSNEKMWGRRKVAAGALAAVVGASALSGCVSGNVSVTKELPQAVKVEMPNGANAESIEGEPTAVFGEVLVAKAHDIIDKTTFTENIPSAGVIIGRPSNDQNNSVTLALVGGSEMLLGAAPPMNNRQSSDIALDNNCVFSFGLDWQSRGILHDGGGLNAESAKRVISYSVESGKYALSLAEKIREVSKDGKMEATNSTVYAPDGSGKIVYKTYEGADLTGTYAVDTKAEFDEAIKAIKNCNEW